MTLPTNPEPAVPEPVMPGPVTPEPLMPAAPLTHLLRSAALAALLFTAVCGLAYPLLTTLAGNALFPAQATGSLLSRDGQVIGSALIGQDFTAPGYLRGRPSQTNRTDGSGPQPYNAENSGASNWGPTNARLRDAAQDRAESFRAVNGLGASAPVPVDMVTASGSGLDPDVSVAAALAQAGRIARERAVAPAQVQAVIRANVTPRSLGVLGEERVNVLRVNLALDDLTAGRR